MSSRGWACVHYVLRRVKRKGKGGSFWDRPAVVCCSRGPWTACDGWSGSGVWRRPSRRRGGGAAGSPGGRGTAAAGCRAAGGTGKGMGSLERASIEGRDVRRQAAA
eukprot:scaffold27465_cov38-Tisochrysis_lutea.AAC.4